MKPEDKYYQLTLLRFVLLTYAISWGIWSLIPILNTDNYFVNLWIAVLGLYGPSLAGIILAYSFHGTWYQHYLPDWRIFIPIFAGSAGLGILYMYQLTVYIDSFSTFLTFGVMFLIFIAAALTAYLLAVMVKSPAGFETRNDKPFQLKDQAGMIAFALLFPLIIGIVSFSIQRALFPETAPFALPELIVSIFQFPIFLISFSFLFSGATNEEIGWRGYLTPKILQRYSPLTVGLVIGIIWSFWHFPLHFTGFYGGGASDIWYRFLWNIPMGIVFTWYYVKSGYNLLGAILLHGAYNMFSYIGEFFVIPAYILTAVIMIVESKMWKSNYSFKRNSVSVE